MDNVELETKVLEIIKEDNYFEMVTKAAAFEKEYKTSDFYKKTKKPLVEVVKEAKIFYALQLRDLARYLQKQLNSIDLSHISELLDNVNETFSMENQDIRETIETFSKMK